MDAISVGSTEMSSPRKLETTREERTLEALLLCIFLCVAGLVLLSPFCHRSNL